MVDYGDSFSIEISYDVLTDMRFCVVVQNFHVRGARCRSLLIYFSDSWTQAVSDVVLTSDGLALLETLYMQRPSRFEHD